MIRKHENSLALKAGALALLVHGLFFLLLVVGFDWRSEPPLRIEDVELWDSLPVPKAEPLPPPEPPKPEPEPKIEPKPEPPPPEPKAEIVVKEKPKPKPEPKAKPEPKPEKKKEEPPKPDPALKKKEEELKKKAEEKKQQELLRKLQQMDDELAEKALNEDAKHLEAARNAEQAQKSAAAASGVVNDYIGKIQLKIRGLMNRQPCGNAEVVYSISIMPTGHVSGTPRLVKSSGVPACDDAALRAIMQAQPLPLPTDQELLSSFRDLRIPFKPEQ